MESDKLKIFATIHKICDTGIKSGSRNAGRDWLAENKLSYQITGAILNSGQIAQHKTQEFLDDLLKVGFLTPSTRPQNAYRERAYRPFAKGAVMFPLRNSAGEVLNFFAVTIKDKKHHFLNNEGIYPHYPSGRVHFCT